MQRGGGKDGSERKRVARGRSGSGVELATGDRGFNPSRCTLSSATLDELFARIVQRL